MSTLSTIVACKLYRWCLIVRNSCQANTILSFSLRALHLKDYTFDMIWCVSIIGSDPKPAQAFDTYPISEQSLDLTSFVADDWRQWCWKIRKGYWWTIVHFPTICSIISEQCFKLYHNFKFSYVNSLNLGSSNINCYRFNGLRCFMFKLLTIKWN